MLEVAHVCPRCGKRLSDSPSASANHLAGRGCHPVVFAALPEPVNPPSAAEDVPPVPAGRKIRDFESPMASPRNGAGVDPTLSGYPRAGPLRALAIPWLHPPDLAEVR